MKRSILCVLLAGAVLPDPAAAPEVDHPGDSDKEKVKVR
jgi:hypothetical protein